MEKVKITAAERDELRLGLRPLKSALKRAAQLGNALELESANRELLGTQQEELVTTLQDLSESGNLSPTLLYASRIAVRLRHGKLARLRAKEEAEGVEGNADVMARIETCEVLGRKLGIQLDLIDHTNGDDDEEEE